MALLPLFGVLSARELGQLWQSLSAVDARRFLTRTALERSGAHRRIAYMVRAFGGNSSRRLVFGFVCKRILSILDIQHIDDVNAAAVA